MSLRAYLPFAGAGIQAQLAYRWNFLGFVLAETLYTFVLYYVWKAVYARSGAMAINGFTMLDMTVYIFASNVTRFLASTEVSYAVGGEIADGSVSMRMIKPISYDRSLLFTELGGMLVVFCMVLVPVFAGLEAFYFIRTGTVHFSVPSFLLYLASALLGYLTVFYFNLCFGYLAFLFKNLWGTNILKDALVRFLSGGLVPIAFFPPQAAVVLKILPFASMCYIPAMIYTGAFGTREILRGVGLQAAWVIAFWALSKAVWRFAVRHLTVQGG